MHQPVFGKLLLFGEYSLLRGGNALSVPFRSYKGILRPTCVSDSAKESHRHLIGFFDYIKSGFSEFFKTERFEKDLENGLYFDSNIPQGYGIGSSGALVAAMLKTYGKKLPNELEERQTLFGAIESHFHGKSSGLDVLVCFENQPILVKGGKAEICTSFTDDMFNHFKVLDSKEVGITSVLVNTFNNQSDKFFQDFDETYVKTSNRCIEWLLDEKYEQLLSGVRLLSRFTQEKMDFSIPSSIQSDWTQQLRTTHSAMKLCGSGGGGFALIFKTALPH